MIYIVSTWSGKVGMTAAEFNQWCRIPDHRGMFFGVESAESEDEHACADVARVRETDTYVRSELTDDTWPHPIDLAAWGMS